MGVMGRANATIPGGGSGEPYLEKDELIRMRTPLAITNVAWDPHGSRQHPNPRWLITVEAWDAANFPIPERAYPADREIEDAGLLSFNNNPTRQAQMESVQAQLDEMRAQGTEWIGPVAVITGKSAAGNPFKTLADIKLLEDGTVVVDARGFPVIDGEEPAPPPPPPTPARRPAGSVRQQSTGQRERAAAGPQTPATAPPAPPAAAPAPPRVSRSATKPATATDVPPAAVPADPAPAPRARRAPRQQATPDPAAPSPSTAAYEAQQKADAARDTAGTQVGPGIQERTETVDEATVTCPFCNAEITGRVYPALPAAFATFYAESAQVFGWPPLTPEQAAAGGSVVPHPHCPVLQMTKMLPVVQFAD